MKKNEFELGRNFSYRVEDGDASRIDPDSDLSYIDEKLKDVLGHLQNDFEGTKFNGYGSFLPTYQRSPSWSFSMSSHEGLQQVPSKLPINRSPFGVKVSSKHGNISERPEKCSDGVTWQSGSRAPCSPMEAMRASQKLICDSSLFKVNSVNGKKSESPKQKHLKIRLKMGCDNLSQKSAAIYSGLGLDNSPSALDSTSESEGISDDPCGSAKHFTRIIKIMTVLPLQGVLMSPLTDKLIQLSDGNWCKNEITNIQDGDSDGVSGSNNVDAVACDDLLGKTLKLPILSVFEGHKAASNKKSKVEEVKHSMGIIDKSHMYVVRETIEQFEGKRQYKNVKVNRSAKTRSENMQPVGETASLQTSEEKSEPKAKIFGNQSCSFYRVDAPEDDGVAGSVFDLIIHNSKHDTDSSWEDILSRQKIRLNAEEIICNDHYPQQSNSVKTITSVENGDINLTSISSESALKCRKYHSLFEEKNKKKTKLSNAVCQNSSENDGKHLKKEVKRSPKFESSNVSKRSSRGPDGWTFDGNGMLNNDLNKGFHNTSSRMILKNYDRSSSKKSNHDAKNDIIDSSLLLKMEHVTSFEELPIDEGDGTSYRKTIETSVGNLSAKSGVVNGTMEKKDCSEVDCSVGKRARGSKLNKMEPITLTRGSNSLNAKLKVKATSLPSNDLKHLLLTKKSDSEFAKGDFGESRNVKNKECPIREISEKVEMNSFKNIPIDNVKDNTNCEKVVTSTNAADDARHLEENYRSDIRNSVKAFDQREGAIVDHSLEYEGKQLAKPNVDENRDFSRSDLSLQPKAIKRETGTKSPLKFPASAFINASPKTVSGPKNKRLSSATAEVDKDGQCKRLPIEMKRFAMSNKLQKGVSDAKTSGKRDYSNQAISNSIKEAKNLKHLADRLKSEREFAESTRLYFESSLKFLYGASLLENCDNAGAESSDMILSTQMYNSTAELCKFCALEYEKSKDIGAAALAYKCMEVAYMRVVYHSHRSCNRDRHQLQLSLQIDPPGGGNHIAARDRTNLEHVLRFVGDVDCAMEASRKALSALSTAKSLGNSIREETLLLIQSAIDFNFHDVDTFLRLVRVAFDSVTRTE